MSARRKRWVLREPAPKSFGQHAGLEPLIATLLYHRNIREEADIRDFLEADYRSGLHDPMLLKGMPEASERIAQAIRNGEQMAVYGDFDTDGVTAVTLLMQAIPALGGKIRPYIPHRTREGYGLNKDAISQLAAEGVDLLITVDCGISNVDEVAHANAIGLDVVVTDHHSPPEKIPQALAVVNPKQKDCTYPYKHLVGVGIAFKLVQALVRRGLKLNLRGRDMLDVVALGTVTDMGPLTGENRVLVRAGLEAINATQRPGLKALIDVSGLNQGAIDATSIGFMLGPRINAAGRLDDAVRAYELLLADNVASAQALAKDLNDTNRERQELTKQVQEAAKAKAEFANKHLNRIVVIADAHFPAGVVGLVAGKLAEDWGRPVLLIEEGEEFSRGSARSIPGFNIIEALRTCGDLFVRYGGHAAAAGFTLANANLPKLDAHLQELAAKELTDEMLVPLLTIDAEIELKTVTWELHGMLGQLAPFGQENPQPVLMSSLVEVVDARAIGRERQHLRLLVRQNGSPEIEAIAFRLGHLADSLQKRPLIDLAYNIDVNEWNNQRKLQLNVRDLRRSK